MQWCQGMIQSLIPIGLHDHVSVFFNQNHWILNRFQENILFQIILWEGNLLSRKLMFHRSICFSFLIRKRSILLQSDSIETTLVPPGVRAQLICELNSVKTHFIDVMMHKLRGFHGLNLDLHLRQLDDWILQSDSRYLRPFLILQIEKSVFWQN